MGTIPGSDTRTPIVELPLISVLLKFLTMADKSSPDFSLKHPLEHTWTLWFDNPNG